MTQPRYAELQASSNFSFLRGASHPQEMAAAEKLAHWQAPTDALLEFPGPQILRDGPQLGETYLLVPLEIGRVKE